MGMFAMRKPRGFHHSYIYVDERKEKLAKMEEDAKRELGMLPEKEFSPEDIRGKFIEGTTHLKRRKESGRRPVHLGVILVVVALLIYLWYAITNGIILYTYHERYHSFAARFGCEPDCCRRGDSASGVCHQGIGRKRD